MAEYLEIRGTIPKEAEDGLAGELSRWSILGVSIEPEADGRVEVGVWVGESDGHLVERIQKLLTDLGASSVASYSREARDWSAEWRRRMVAFEVGERWWIDPHPDCSTDAPGNRLRLAVEPRAAFGSGTHESTRLVLMQLEDVDCEGRRVLDVGTGSGVLAVAADRLGADVVVAVDTDPIAAWEARETARKQDWRCRPLVAAGAVDCLDRIEFDVVLCNMILSEFSPFLDRLSRVLTSDGSVVLSGILGCERTAVESLLGECGMKVVGEKELGEWISLRAVPLGAA